MDGDGQAIDMMARLTALEARLQQLGDLAERVAQLEEMATLITDVSRYQRLQQLLSSGDLKAADQETVHVILQESGATDREGLTPNEVKRFPCSVLQVIDRLWIKYTDGRFGFSVQLQLYQQAGGSLETAISQDLSVLRRLGDSLGWRENNQWKTLNQARYAMDDPVGCYPVVWWDSPYGAKMVNYFMTRLFTCEL